MRTPSQDDPEAPVLTIEGLSLFGGISALGKPDDAAATGEPA